MSFELRRAATLSSLNSSVTDKSPKGMVDATIIPLLSVLNSHPNYFTTSSCSGRISIFSHPKNRPKGGTWLYITHEPADPDTVLSLLFPAESNRSSNELVFRFEPLIVAVECKDVESAHSLVSLAVSSGLRESGITSVKRRVIVGIRSSLRLEVPFGEMGSVLVSEDYVRFLVGVANEKMEGNRRRTDGFLRALLGSTCGFVTAAVTNDRDDNSDTLRNIDGDDSSGHISF